MRIVFILLIAAHGFTHLFGFLKAFEIAEFNTINQPISKASGLFWLLTFLLFAITIIMVLIRSEYFWVCGLLALIISQILIFMYWSDAKFGTIVNLIILLVILVAYSDYSFKNTIEKERKALFKNSKNTNQKIILKDDISDLPEIVQKWLIHSGVIGKPKTTNLCLTQELQLKLKPEQTKWNKGTAEQYFTIQPPAFNWNINTKMNSILGVTGRDKFVDGKGEIVIKLLSIIAVADEKNNEKIDQAALQRYLAEIVWFPSASLSPYIEWESLDSNAAKATMQYKGTKGSGVFYFDENGQFKKFVAFRYKEANDVKPKKWTVTATKTEERNGIKIPVECEVSWHLDTKQWTWLKLKIKYIEYNTEQIPVTNSVHKK
ncbi:hypothetical protein ATO12_15610 [Aquimarina atlantica]|uniref:Uncharacterized protein n=1 Tax=Aquimarina atlantica TaxID=1317122 RepID=A0A023BW96_9FLAO|nr:DUF6544 family protein [Aquimarina atlantica]EZH74291.1 hypothetical protein ATO12_15610 [Aquimarina atlantica]